MSATQVPWEQRAGNPYDVVSPEYGQVAACEFAEDAAFIVRAVNSHDDLLAALKGIRAHRPDHADNAWDAVDEAITKAEDRS